MKKKQLDNFQVGDKKYVVYITDGGNACVMSADEYSLIRWENKKGINKNYEKCAS